MKQKITIVVPSYNEEKHIGTVLKELQKISYDVCVVDDGSKDRTANIARKYTKHVIVHNLNLGKGAAMKTGCEWAFKNGSTAVIFLDSDGQHKISDLGKFVEKINQGCELVYGSRNLSYGVPLVRFLGNKFGSILIALLFGVYVSDLLCGYRAISRKVYPKIKWDSSRYGVETEMVVRAAKKKILYCEVPVETVYLDGVKGVTILDAINIFFDVLRWKVTL